MDSPVGRLTLVASADGLARDPLGARPARPGAAAARRRGAGTIRCWSRPSVSSTEYFAGQRRAFALPLDCRGHAVSAQVWQALLTIPFGETRSYGEIARQIGSPAAVRAVGAANGRNPLSIVAPCHRVIGAGGQLTGFAGGLEAKAYLLALEGIPGPGATHADAGSQPGWCGGESDSADLALHTPSRVASTRFRPCSCV